jgi:phage-related protein
VIRGFPKQVRERLGRNLFRLQMGEPIGMPLSRPMRSLAAGVSELRLAAEQGAYRVLYYAASPRGILVFHAFVKKTRRTPSYEIQLARKHLRELFDA